MWLAAVAGAAAGIAAGLTVPAYRRWHRLRRILDHLPDGVILFSRRGDVLMANTAAAEFVGLQGGWSRRRFRLALARIPDLSTYVEGALSGSGGEDGPTIEVGYPEVRYLRVQAAPLDTEEVLLTLTDVTTLQRLEAVRRRFTADLSHQLRTPVTSIRLLVETLEQRVDDTVTGRIVRETGRLEQLVDEILTLSRLEAGEEQFSPESFHIAQLVTEAVEVVSPQISRKDIDLRLELDDEPWWGDYPKLLRTLEVYLDNAIKFSPPSGSITISSRTIGDYHTLLVIDEGPGIAQHEQPYVFHRFYRGRRQAGSGGFGLGLAVAKHAVAAHGGQVFVESQVGTGSTFGFRLPRRNV